MNGSERHRPFAISEKGKAIGPPPLHSESFRENLLALDEDELPGYLRSYVRDRVPAAFVSRPMLWEAIRRWVSVRLQVEPLEIGLAGSAQVGFSCAPDRYGTEFSLNGSDLDLFVVNRELFEKLEAEIRRFVSQPNELDGGRYRQQRETLRNTSRRGFADLKHVPAIHDKYLLCSAINNYASMIVHKLCKHEMTLRKSHFRIYRSWKELAAQTLVNFKHLRTKISGLG
jgi:hypothetical protein